MDGNRHAPAIGMVPSLVASGLSTPDESELTGHSLELPRDGGREIGPPLFHKILRQLGLSLEEFERLR